MMDLFHGVLRVEQTAEGFVPYRFTEKALKAWGDRREGWLIRALCTSSVSMAFVTDASQFSLRFLVRNFSRPFVGFDIYENGCYARHIAFEDTCTEGIMTYSCRQEGEKRIDIYLSCLNQIIITGLDAGNVRPVPQNPHRILFLGDSITQGMTAKCPSIVYPTLYARQKGLQPVNLGVGGAKYEAWQLEDFPDYAPEQIMIAYGINDLYNEQNTGLLLRNAAEYLEKLNTLCPQCPKTVITPIWNRAIDEDEGFAPRFSLYARELTAEAKALGYAVIDGLRIFPQERRFTFDGTHPTEEGFAMMTLGLLNA